MRAKNAKTAVESAPAFRSEAEEAEWWDRHQDLISDLLLNEGRRGAALLHEALKKESKSASKQPPQH